MPSNIELHQALTYWMSIILQGTISRVVDSILSARLNNEIFARMTILLSVQVKTLGRDTSLT